MDYFFLYLLGQDIRSTLWMSTFLFWMFILLVILFNAMDKNKFIPPTTISIVTLFLLWFLATITPSQDALKYMWAYYVGKQAIQSETTQKLITILNQRLDEEIKNNLTK